MISDHRGSRCDLSLWRSRATLGLVSNVILLTTLFGTDWFTLNLPDLSESVHIGLFQYKTTSDGSTWSFSEICDDDTDDNPLCGSTMGALQAFVILAVIAGAACITKLVVDGSRGTINPVRERQIASVPLSFGVLAAILMFALQSEIEDYYAQYSTADVGMRASGYELLGCVAMYATHAWAATPTAAQAARQRQQQQQQQQAQQQPAPAPTITVSQGGNFAVPVAQPVHQVAQPVPVAQPMQMGEVLPVAKALPPTAGGPQV